jgi:hypothetical protein
MRIRQKNKESLYRRFVQLTKRIFFCSPDPPSKEDADSYIPLSTDPAEPISEESAEMIFPSPDDLSDPPVAAQSECDEVYATYPFALPEVSPPESTSDGDLKSILTAAQFEFLETMYQRSGSSSNVDNAMTRYLASCVEALERNRDVGVSPRKSASGDIYSNEAIQHLEELKRELVVDDPVNEQNSADKTNP